MDDDANPQHGSNERQLRTTLESVQKAADALGDLARRLGDAVTNDGIMIRPPGLMYYLKKYAWQLIGGGTMIILGAIVERNDSSITKFLIATFG